MLHRKIAVILAADVAGYVRLVAENEEQALARLDSVRTIAEGLISQAEGRIFNTAGDAIMAEFKSAVDAVRCALAIQSSLRAGNENYPPSRQMWLRIGVSIGDVFEREGDLLGDAVNMAARLESIGAEGGVCISRSVYEVVANKVTAHFSDRGLQRLKNMPEPIHVYSLKGFETPAFAGKSSSAGRWVLAAALIVFVAICAAAGGAYYMIRVEEPSLAAATPLERPSSGQRLASRPETVAPHPPEPTSESEVRARRLKRCFNDPAPVAISLCREIAAENRLSNELQAQVELRLGTLLREHHDAKGAMDALTQSISHGPTSAAFNQRGIAEFKLGHMERAIADFNDALRIDANNGEALNNRAWTYYKANRARAGLEDANRAVKLLSDRAFVWDTRAHIHEALGDSAAALHDYRKALSLDANITTSKEGLARLEAKP